MSNYNPNGPGKEPMLLLDTTGSMNYGTSATSKTPRRVTIQEAISLLVEALAREDSEAEHEEGGGGLRTITFANGLAQDLEDLNPRNLREKWNSIVWDGGTLIMPGWNKMLQVYTEEFGDRPGAQRPKLLALIITDGEARDFQAFAKAIRQSAGNIYIALTIIGYGEEHERTLAAYQEAATQNPAHVQVYSFGSQTDPQEIARGLLQMIE